MIGNVRSGESFGGLVLYVLDKEEAFLIGGNMLGETSSEIVEEFEHVRALRHDVSRPVWHFSLSAYPGELVGEQRWNFIARDYLKLMGISTANHQFIVALHSDRDHKHIHAVVNRIGFNGKLWHNKWDRLRSREVCLQLEAIHGLRQTKPRTRPHEIERSLMSGL